MAADRDDAGPPGRSACGDSGSEAKDVRTDTAATLKSPRRRTLRSRDVKANLASALSGLPAAVPRPDTARIGLGGVTGLIIRPVTPPAKRVSLVLCLCLCLCFGLEFLLEFNFLLEFLLEFSFG
jgi:hypothetical protein